VSRPPRVPRPAADRRLRQRRSVAAARRSRNGAAAPLPLHLHLAALLLAALTALPAALPAAPRPAAAPACTLPRLGALEALGRAGRDAALAELAGAEHRCGTSADFYALRGALLYHQGRYLDAARDLEHAILLEPRHGGALIDYALTLDALGERAAARAIVAGLRRQRRLPSHIAALLAALEVRLAAPPPPAAAAPAGATASPPPVARRHWLRVSLLGGYSSNLNAAPSADSLTLTLPGADIDVALAPESRPRPGGLLRFAVDLVPEPLPLGGDASLVLLGQMRLYQPFEGSDGRLAHGRLEAVAARRADRRLDLLGLSVEALDIVPGGTQGGFELYAERRWPGARWGDRLSDWWGGQGGKRAVDGRGGGCTPGLRLALLAQSWPDEIAAELAAGTLAGIPYLDGIEPRLTARLGCGAAEWSAYAGRLLARADRAGGDANRLGLRLSRRWTLSRGTLDLLGDVAYLGDASGYSPLLARNDPRHILRLDLALEWEHPAARLGPGWRWVARLEHGEQRSNLPLFDLRQSGAYLGLRWEGDF
jgi:tetratricopeptide (TPR) repeat protein